MEDALMIMVYENDTIEPHMIKDVSDPEEARMVFNMYHDSGISLNGGSGVTNCIILTDKLVTHEHVLNKPDLPEDVVSQVVNKRGNVTNMLYECTFFGVMYQVRVQIHERAEDQHAQASVTSTRTNMVYTETVDLSNDKKTPSDIALDMFCKYAIPELTGFLNIPVLIHLTNDEVIRGHMNEKPGIDVFNICMK